MCNFTTTCPQQPDIKHETLIFRITTHKAWPLCIMGVLCNIFCWVLHVFLTSHTTFFGQLFLFFLDIAPIAMTKEPALKITYSCCNIVKYLLISIALGEGKAKYINDPPQMIWSKIAETFSVSNNEGAGKHALPGTATLLAFGFGFIYQPLTLGSSSEILKYSFTNAEVRRARVKVARIVILNNYHNEYICTVYW